MNPIVFRYSFDIRILKKRFIQYLSTKSIRVFSSVVQCKDLWCFCIRETLCFCSRAYNFYRLGSEWRKKQKKAKKNGNHDWQDEYFIQFSGTFGVKVRKFKIATENSKSSATLPIFIKFGFIDYLLLIIEREFWDENCKI